jgi:hypothetical protein
VVAGSAGEVAAPGRVQGQQRGSGGEKPLPAARRGHCARPISRPVRAGLLAFSLFCFFYLINRGEHLDCLRKVTINRDL